MLSDSIPVSRGILASTDLVGSLGPSQGKMVAERNDYSPGGTSKEEKKERMRRVAVYEQWARSERELAIK